MKKVLLSGVVMGLALVAFAGCTQQVVPEKLVHPVGSKCDMGKADSIIAKCGN